MPQGKRIVLASRPIGEPTPSDFRVEECLPREKPATTCKALVALRTAPRKAKSRSILRRLNLIR
jgi:hypothetical protein